MKTYLVKLGWDDPYPKLLESRVRASSIFRACVMIGKEWKKQNPRKRIGKIKVEAVKI